MTSGLVEINGTRLYVATYGRPADPAVLYVHGGPGQGCYHFEHSQADLLGRDCYLVCVDHRGAFRSDPLPADPPLSFDLLVHDLDEVREHLGLSSWALIGHSAGAATALTYALELPERVNGVVFDCPALDADLVDRWRLPIAARLLTELGKPAAAERARVLARQSERLSPITYEVLDELGSRLSELFLHDDASIAEFDRVTAQSGFSEQVWGRGSSHRPLLADLYTSRLHLLDELTRPALLIRGIDDPVSPPDVVAAFRASPTCRAIVEIEDARHFPSFEQPVTYARSVTDFLAGLTG